MSGDWDVLFEHYGPASHREDHSEIVEVRQEGSSFVAVTSTDTDYMTKSSEILPRSCIK
jgi:hypothetical protein